MARHVVTSDDLLQRVRVLEQKPAESRAEVAALKTARDIAMRLSTWGGLRRQPIEQLKQTQR